MVPDKFNMVDMGGIDLIMMQGEAVPGLYQQLMAAISNCRYQCLYNWLFDGVLIPPAYVQIENDDDEVFLNEGVSVTSDDVIHIYSVEPGPVDPEIIPLLAEENGTYNVPAGKDGFNPVTVDVPSHTPVINPITITENGTYNVPAGVDVYAPVVVNVEGGSMTRTELFYAADGALSGSLSEDITSFDYVEFELVHIESASRRWSYCTTWPKVVMETTFSNSSNASICAYTGAYFNLSLPTVTSFTNLGYANVGIRRITGINF